MSGSSVAYNLRVNKYIDRRLFVEAILLAGRYQSFSQHAYISMGGSYLEDFRTIHQAVGIRAMLSFDFDQWVVERQRLNRPFGFIRCVRSSSTELVERFGEQRESLVGPDGRVIVWLDFTQPSKRYEQLEDLEKLARQLVPGDVFRITLNAQRNSFGSNDQYLNAKQSDKTTHPTLSDWWHEKLVEQLDDYLPPERDDSEYMRTDGGFATTLALAVRRAALRGLPEHQAFILQPLLSVSYADGQQMLTVTAIVLPHDQRDQFLERVRWNEWAFRPGDDWEPSIRLSVPALSARERQVIHDKMYFRDWPDFPSLLDFRLDGSADRHAELVNQYVTHYLRYPIYAPVDVT